MMVSCVVSPFRQIFPLCLHESMIGKYACNCPSEQLGTHWFGLSDKAAFAFLTDFRELHCCEKMIPHMTMLCFEIG